MERDYHNPAPFESLRTRPKSMHHIQCAYIPNSANSLVHLGPVTDYGSTTVQWMRNRRPRYKGNSLLEMERPSPSYIVDVCTFRALHPCYPTKALLDAPALRKIHKCGRNHPSQSPTLLSK